MCEQRVALDMIMGHPKKGACQKQQSFYMKSNVVILKSWRGE